MNSIQSFSDISRTLGDFANALITPTLDLAGYLEYCYHNRSWLFDLFDFDRLLSKDYTATLETYDSYFESKNEGGRGDDYRTAQVRYPLARSCGIQALFNLAAGNFPLSSDLVILDVLGGNGTLTRTMRLLYNESTCPKVITSDISPTMIADALSHGFPAIRQPAQRLVLRDLALDGVILAYGTHHIAPNYRLTALQEAYRVLRVGGIIVIQDYEAGTPTARWYSELLDRYTLTGHKFEHFTKDSMHDLLVRAGFVNCRICIGYDPFVLYGKTAQQAKENLYNYVVQLFSLEKLKHLRETCHDMNEYFTDLADIIFPYAYFKPSELPKGIPTVQTISISREGGEYRAELPRVVLIGIGQKA